MAKKVPSTQERVTRVIDGDTFETANRREKIRLAAIRLSDVNAPERGTPEGEDATRELCRLIDGKTVTITPKGRSYGRVVAEVTVDGYLVNEVMQDYLRKMGWH